MQLRVRDEGDAPPLQLIDDPTLQLLQALRLAGEGARLDPPTHDGELTRGHQREVRRRIHQRFEIRREADVPFDHRRVAVATVGLECEPYLQGPERPAVLW